MMKYHPAFPSEQETLSPGWLYCMEATETIKLQGTESWANERGRDVGQSWTMLVLQALTQLYLFFIFDRTWIFKERNRSVSPSIDS